MPLPSLVLLSSLAELPDDSLLLLLLSLLLLLLRFPLNDELSLEPSWPLDSLPLLLSM
jgi:hypothetical protein